MSAEGATTHNAVVDSSVCIFCTTTAPASHSSIRAVVPLTFVSFFTAPSLAEWGCIDLVFAVLETEPRITSSSSNTADAETLYRRRWKYPLKSHFVIMTILSCSKTVVPEVPEKGELEIEPFFRIHKCSEDKRLAVNLWAYTHCPALPRYLVDNCHTSYGLNQPTSVQLVSYLSRKKKKPSK